MEGLVLDGGGIACQEEAAGPCPRVGRLALTSLSYFVDTWIFQGKGVVRGNTWVCVPVLEVMCNLNGTLVLYVLVVAYERADKTPPSRFCADGGTLPRTRRTARQKAGSLDGLSAR